MKPCITTWPAIVPTEDEAKPEASRAIAEDRRGAVGDQLLQPVVGALDRVDRRSGRWRGRAPAATIIIERLTSPASDIAITTSTFSKPRIRFFSASSRPTIRRWVSAECR